MYKPQTLNPPFFIVILVEERLEPMNRVGWHDLLYICPVLNLPTATLPEIGVSIECNAPYAERAYPAT